MGCTLADWLLLGGFYPCGKIKKQIASLIKLFGLQHLSMLLKKKKKFNFQMRNWSVENALLGAFFWWHL